MYPLVAIKKKTTTQHLDSKPDSSERFQTLVNLHQRIPSQTLKTYLLDVYPSFLWHLCRVGLHFAIWTHKVSRTVISVQQISIESWLFVFWAVWHGCHFSLWCWGRTCVGTQACSSGWLLFRELWFSCNYSKCLPIKHKKIMGSLRLTARTEFEAKLRIIFKNWSIFNVLCLFGFDNALVTKTH